MTEMALEPEWLRWATGKPPTILNTWDGTPSLFLAPTSDGGAILWWLFDRGDDGSDYILIVHLTASEAQTVFETRSGGPLDRLLAKSLEDNRLVVSRNNPQSGEERTFIFFLRGQLTGEQFGQWLIQTADILESANTSEDAGRYFASVHETSELAGQVVASDHSANTAKDEYTNISTLAAMLLSA
jgi:hypothetical protein